MNKETKNAQNKTKEREKETKKERRKEERNTMFEHAHVHRDHQLMFARTIEKKPYLIYLVKSIHVCIWDFETTPELKRRRIKKINSYS